MSDVSHNFNRCCSVWLLLSLISHVLHRLLLLEHLELSVGCSAADGLGTLRKTYQRILWDVG